MSATLNPASRSRPLTLDDVILLNDEIRGLIAAGVPLDVGLAGFASRVHGRLKAFAERLADRIASGTPLEQAVEAEAGVLPGEYRIVLAIGLKSGRFDAALGSMAHYAASVRELRNGLQRALIYPGIVCCLAFALLAVIFAYVVPMLLHNVDSLGLPHSDWYGLFDRLHRSVTYWGIGIPAVVLLSFIVLQALRWTRRLFGSATSTAQLSLGVWRWIPGISGALRAAHWSRFAHLLAVLVEAGVPFLEAARLSAGSVGDRRVVRSIEGLCERMALGQRRTALDRRSGLPPLLRWLMTWGEEESMLAPALREAAAQYEQRALIRAELVQRFVPLAVVVFVGGALTYVYALTVFVPLTSMWTELATGQ